MNLTGNEPAMPSKIDGFDHHLGNTTRNVPGLTIRQHFAAIAMQGILSNQELRIGLYKDARNRKDDLDLCIAKEAVEQADALIKELNK